jgi:hydroxyethylthiazole kinase-like uncharacterized protein yjeF
LPRAEFTTIDAALLRTMPLPTPDDDADKNQRGHVLIIGGGRETPGGVALAGIAALRAGAGRVRIATVASVATALAVAFPETRVIGLPEDESGSIRPTAAARLEQLVERADVVLIGTSTIDPDATGRLLADAVPWCAAPTNIVVDAAAIPELRDRPHLLHTCGNRAVVIPNADEIGVLVGNDDRVDADLSSLLDHAVGMLRTCVAIRGATTVIGDPSGARLRDDSGGPALGTSGSGDVLAGLLAGLLARGLAPLAATAWAVHAHRAAASSVRGGSVGLLARELLPEIPAVLEALGSTAELRHGLPPMPGTRVFDPHAG